MLGVAVAGKCEETQRITYHDASSALFCARQHFSGSVISKKRVTPSMPVAASIGLVHAVGE